LTIPPVFNDPNCIRKSYFNERYIKKLKIAKFLYDFRGFPPAYSGIIRNE